MSTPTPSGPYKPVLILHGGAGAITRASLPQALYQAYHASLLSYVTSTHDLLTKDGNALAAACHAVCLMEDDPLFNCGRGSVFNLHGEIEMEASVAVTSVDDSLEYEGKVKRSAAVSMVKRTRHPILLARMVLGMGDEQGDGRGGLGGTAQMHGHLSGREVERAGWRAGLERKGKGWFWTRRRWEEHRRGLKGLSGGCDDDGKDDDDDVFTGPCCSQDADIDASSEDELDDDEEVDTQEPIGTEHILELPSQGTVGAVCMDSWGVIAVATSTGGLTNKRPGRIGDTPTVGAGFWAESWIEQIMQSQREAATRPKPGFSFSKKLATAAKSEFNFWLGDCLTSEAVREDVARGNEEKCVDKQPLIPSGLHLDKHPSTRSSISRKAVAMSGTGNGDSFLRTNACRTAAAIARFSLPSNTISLSEAIHAIAGPGGELQNSAGDRWGKTGEGEGGIIGIEIASDGDGGGEGTAVFDFNCGGLWRAYFERSEDGSERPRVMVFREEY